MLQQRSQQLLHRCFALAPGQTAVLRCRAFASESTSDDEQQFTVKVNPYKAYKVDPPPTEVQTSKAELMDMFKKMYIYRWRHAPSRPGLQPVE